MNICDTYLRTATQPVALETAEQQQQAQQIASDMLAAMRRLGGIGLAANQVGLNISVFVMSVSPQREFFFFNPEIVAIGTEPLEFAEGCLSYPDEYITISRPNIVQIQWYSANGQSYMDIFEGLEARVIFHEMDHLMGITMHDRYQLELTKPLEKQLEQ